MPDHTFGLDSPGPHILLRVNERELALLIAGSGVTIGQLHASISAQLLAADNLVAVVERYSLTIQDSMILGRILLSAGNHLRSITPKET